MKDFFDVFYTEEKNPMQRLRIYLPETESFPVFVYFHGGGLSADVDDDEEDDDEDDPAQD